MDASVPIQIHVTHLTCVAQLGYGCEADTANGDDPMDYHPWGPQPEGEGGFGLKKCYQISEARARM